MADTAKSSSGLHIHAAPFVPGSCSKADLKSNNGPAASKPGSTANGNATQAKGPVGNAAAQVSAPDKPAEERTAAAAAPAGSSKGSGGGAKGSKGGGKQGGSGGGASKLAAAASAAPFVPSTTKPAASAAAGQQQPPAAEKAKQQGKGKGKQQQQQQQQQQKEQKASGKDAGSSSSGGGAKDAKALAAAKMSPTAMAFVPKTGTASTTSTPSAAAAAAVAASEALKGASASQQQKGGSGGGATSSGGAAVRIAKFPAKPNAASAGGSSSSAPASAGTSSAATAAAAAAAAPSPNRVPVSSNPRGSRAGRGPGDSGLQGSSSRSNLNPMAGGTGASGAYGVGSGGGAAAGGTGAGAAAGAWNMQHQGGGGSNMGAAGQGPGTWGLLAQYQGSYGPMYALGGYGGYGHAGGYGAHHHHHPHHMGAPAKQLLSAQFMPEGLRQQLQQSNSLIQVQYTASADEPALPDKLGHYHTLYPLEDLAAAESAGVSTAWGVRTTCLKGINSRDGHAYCLRVVCGKQVIPSLEMLSVVRAAVDAWSSLTHHPGLLVPQEGFVASELDGSPSLVVTTSYVPGAVTLAQAHLQPTQTASGQLVRNTPSEEVLWGYTTQLAAVLRAAHSMGLALRPATLSATKVLVTPVGRLKVCGLGVSEALAGEVVPSGAEELLQLQRDDVVAMGQLLLQLACAAGGLPSPSLDFAHAHYSPEFVRMLMLLLGVAEGGAFSWRAVSALLGERLLLEMDTLAIFNEQLLDALTREMENGRLFRLVSKLAFVTDRNSSDVCAASGDTGNSYLLQLFRDFVFHQGERDGGRVIDWGHIVENLNKLDAGVAEQVLLQSRDERSLLVMSYADIKRCVEAAVSEIRVRGAGGSSSQQPGAGSGVGMMRPPAHAGGMYHRGGLHHMGPR